MADKRISQLIERVNIANSDVLPIVASGATTTNKATISSIQTFMQSNLDVGVTSVGITIGTSGTNINVTGSPVTSSGNITINIPTASATNRGVLNSADWNTFNSKLSSVGLIMPSAFVVSNTPLTTNGSISVAGAGTVSQYIRGDGSLADFPSGGGGGSSVNYYLNGSVNQGTIGGIAYKEINKTPILGAGTDFVAIADGYLASFITDAGDPALLQIPAGNWNFETYFSASSAGGSPSFYIELYKVDSGGTATLIASNSATPELIAFGTVINPYFSTLAVPTTALTITDRLALRYYVSRSGRTITLHTENSHLCEIITTFTTGLTALNGLTAQVQNFATGTSGTDFAISSTSATHTFNLPDASASARGVVTTGTQTFGGIKNFSSTIVVNQDLQLAAAGTASTTFIKNINGAGLTSIGSNGFGFNNSDNIYFSGSNKGGGVFAFNNTGNRTYTLQDASGTLALSSDLGAYLPLTGGTISGQLNVGSGNLRIAAEGASNITILRNFTGTAQGQSGFNHVGFNNSNNFYFTKNLNNGCILSFNNTAYRTYTFPDSDATIASTSNLASYLPLTGGTLTGALSGTSAVFSSTTEASNSSAASVVLAGGLGVAKNIRSSQNIIAEGVAGTIATLNGGDFQVYTSGNANYSSISSPSSGNMVLKVNIGATPINALTLASTGAATFSSSVNLGTNANAADTASLNIKQAGTSYNQGIYIERGGERNGYHMYIGGALDSLTFRRNYFGTQSDVMSLTRDGNVGIGTASPAAALDIQFGSSSSDNQFRIRKSDTLTTFLVRGDGAVFASGVYGFTTGSAANVVVFSDGSLQRSTSSIKYKKNVQNYSKGLEEVMLLRPVTYEGISESDEGKTFAGLIAEEVHDLGLTEFVQYAEDGSPDALSYSNMVSLLVKAIQELKTEIDSLKNQMQ